MNASELLVECLKNEGVEYIFGLPGEENIAFLEADRPVVIKVPVDYRENIKLTEKLGKIVCPI